MNISRVPSLSNFFANTALTVADTVFKGIDFVTNVKRGMSYEQAQGISDMYVRGHVAPRAIPHAVRIHGVVAKSDSDDGKTVRVNREDIRYARDFLDNEGNFENPGEVRQLLVSTLTDALDGSGAPDDPNKIKEGDSDREQIKKLRRQVLEPLRTVFLNNDIINATLKSLGIPKLLEGKTNNKSGCILNGPPGTGKTILLRAIAQVYSNMGCPVVEINYAEASDRYVGSLAKNLDETISSILRVARKEGKPAFIFLDEATVAVLKVEKANSVRDYYQGALDVLKKYIGNYPELVFGISTNGDREDFDEALIRDLRLEVHTIDYPGLPEKIRMWEHFIREFNVIDDLSLDQYTELANAFPKESQGAAIVKFCQGVIEDITIKRLQERGYQNIMEILMAGISLYDEESETRKAVKYEDILALAKSFKTDSKEREKPRRRIGFELPVPAA